jgi:hypothetical protein
VAGGPAAVLWWQVLPASAGAKHPQDTIQGTPVIGSGSTSAFMLREQRSNQPPLLVSQLFILHLKPLIQRLKVEFRLSSRFLGLVYK